MDRAKSYRPNIQSDEIVVAVTCGDRCDIARSFLTDYGASDVASASPQAIQGAKARGASAMSILTPQDTERVIDIDGVIEVKDGPYVEPDMVDLGDIG